MSEKAQKTESTADIIDRSTWTSRELDSVAEFLNGKAFSPDDWTDEGLPIIRIANMTDPTSDFNRFDDIVKPRYRIDSGDLLFSWSATLMVMEWRHGPAILNQHIFKVVPREGIDRAFLKYLLDFKLDDLAGSTHGTTMKHIKRKDLLPFEVSIPPLPQQRYIADILDTVDRAIRKTEEVIDKLERIKKGLLHDLLTRGIDENGQLRDPHRHPEQFNQTELGLLPKEWENRSLVDLIELPSGQVDPTIQPYIDRPLIAPNHVEQRTGRLLQLETARAQEASSGKYPFKPGDVVYSKIRPYLRKAVLVGFDGTSSADMYPLRPKLNKITSEFLLFIMLSENFSQFAEALSMRTGIPKLNRTELAEYSRPIPRLAEQRRISEKVDQISAQIANERRLRTKLADTKRGLSRELLSQT